MKFKTITTTTAGNDNVIQEGNKILEDDYKTARELGVLRIGEDGVFFRSGFTKYYAPYQALNHVFRRIVAVPAKLCCGNGNFELEYIVLADGDTELAQIQMPGPKASEEALRLLHDKLPDADFTAIHADPDNVQQGTKVNT